jgi:hypothetical protein
MANKRSNNGKNKNDNNEDDDTLAELSSFSEMPSSIVVKKSFSEFKMPIVLNTFMFKNIGLFVTILGMTFCVKEKLKSLHERYPIPAGYFKFVEYFFLLYFFFIRVQYRCFSIRRSLSTATFVNWKSTSHESRPICKYLDLGVHHEICYSNWIRYCF